MSRQVVAIFDKYLIINWVKIFQICSHGWCTQTSSNWKVRRLLCWLRLCHPEIIKEIEKCHSKWPGKIWTYKSQIIVILYFLRQISVDYFNNILRKSHLIVNTYFFWQVSDGDRFDADNNLLVGTCVTNAIFHFDKNAPILKMALESWHTLFNPRGWAR